MPCQYLSGLPGNLTAADGFAAGEIARPTSHPWAGGGTKSAAARQARRWADAGITPLPRGRRACRSRFDLPFAVYCRAGVHARRGVLRQRKAQGTMPASSPAEAGQGGGLCRIPLPQTGNAPLRLRLAAHPPPLAGEALGGLPFERLPCKGLRSRAPPAADTARRSRCRGRRMQARFSVRRMMRGPQTGNVGASRLRGAAPCPANTLPGCLKPPRRDGWRRRTGFGGQTVRGRLTISGGDAKNCAKKAL